MITEVRYHLRRCLASGLLAVGSIAALMAPAVTHAASSEAPSRAANAKSVSLRLADVLHVLGRNISTGPARYSKPNAMGACTSTPPATDYTANFTGPLRTKDVLTVISDVYTYKSAGGPTCNQKLEVTEYKLVGAITGKITAVHGVGDQAFILDATGPKTSQPPVYSLALKFTRGLYRAIIIVQSMKPIRVTDMIRLGVIVDGRMKLTR